MIWRAGSGLTVALMLAGCGGGGGVGTIPAPAPLPTPTPTPTPTPSPTPTPNPSPFNTAEFRRSSAVGSSNAIVAYEAGATGRGIIAAVIDSGVDATSAEFAGRISPLSRDAAGSRGLGDEDGHGTSVSGILLAARNGVSIHGVAFEATLLAIRADRPGSCATDCQYVSSAIAGGLDTAAVAGARVVNLSLGGPSVSGAVAAGLARATNGGAVVVVSAGNDAAGEVDPFASSAISAAARGTVIVAGAVDAAGNISSFSNRAGVVADNYLVALGERVRSFDENGVAFDYSGTSEAAPIISGAVALVAGAFPTLSNGQIVDLLLRTADDLGAPGTDSVYGRGRLNIGRAFAPVGSMSVTGVAVPINGATGSLGAPLGDGGATGAALSQVLARDFYGRAFRVDVARSLRSANAGRLGIGLIGDEVRTAGGAVGGVALSFVKRGVSAAGQDLGWRSAVLAAGNPAVGRRQALVSGRAVVPVAANRVAVLGFGQPLGSLVDAAAGQGAGAGALVAGIDHGNWAGRDVAGAAMAQQFGGMTATLGLATSRHDAVVRSTDPATATRALLRIDRDFGALRLGVSGEYLVERGAMLGSRLSTVFGLQGAETMTAGLRARWLSHGWTVAAETRFGITRAALGGGGLVQQLAGLHGTAAMIEIGRHAVLGSNDRLRLTVAQPLRASGRAVLALGDDPVSVGLASGGREVATELGYGLPIGAGWIDVGLFWREQPGHLATAAPDFGGSLRLRMGY